MIVAGVNSQLCEEVWMTVSGTGKWLGWQYPVLLLVLAVQTSTVQILLHINHYRASTTLPGLFWASLMPYHHLVL